MRIKRMLSALLAAALLVSLAVLPVGAAKSSFVDVSDNTTAVNADILRLMGVVSGTGGDYFNPNGVLTRAQFCAMVVNFVQAQDQLAIHSTRTIFTDVPGSHWARSYVNLAASLTVKDGEKEISLIAGTGDGRFLPDSEITVAAAATILLRALGYTGQQTGSLWPQSYMNLAGSIGLTDGLPADYNSPLTRAQAAQLFVNALSCKTQDGKLYYTTLGEEKKDVVLLAVNVSTDVGDALGAVRTSGGTYLPKTENVAPTALQGRRGSLVLDGNQEIVTFVPDDTTPVTVTLSGDAQPSYIRAGSTQYTISSSTPVYTADQEEGKSYLDAYSSLYSGSQLTMFTQRGKVVAIYTNSSSTSIDADAVVVMGNATEATFHQLTGGASNFNIVKNRQSIRMSDIKPYDVVTYDAMTNTLIVSDLRLTCVYQDAVPNMNTPKTITVLGNKFDVLESAWNTTKDFKLGDTVSLLLTADGKVAGMAATGSKTRSTAVGMVSGGSLEIFLPTGGTLKLNGTVSNASNVEGQLVIVSANKSSFTASRLAENRAPGAFNVDKMTLGSYTVIGGVRIFEKVTTSAMAPIDRSDLTMGSISADQISGYHLNSSGMVDYIVLNNVTGNAYEYGMMIGTTETTRPDPDDPDGETTSKTTWYLAQGVGGIKFAETAGYNGRSGDIVGVVTYKNRNDQDMIRSIIQLEQLKNVSGKDFFESQGTLYVSVNGQNYKVADDVKCYSGIGSNRTDPNSWFTQSDTADRVNAMKAFSDKLTLYIDPVGKQVRVITAG